jgi:uncharacterized protein YeeX (DUF496 family)
VSLFQNLRTSDEDWKIERRKRKELTQEIIKERTKVTDTDYYLTILNLLNTIKSISSSINVNEICENFTSLREKEISGYTLTFNEFRKELIRLQKLNKVCNTLLSTIESLLQEPKSLVSIDSPSKYSKEVELEVEKRMQISSN